MIPARSGVAAKVPLVVALSIAIAIACPLATTVPALANPSGDVECLAEGSVYSRCGPGWELAARHYPTNLAPGKRGALQIEVFNIGAAASVAPVTVTDVLPPGVSAIDAGNLVGGFNTPEEIQLAHNKWDCHGNGAGPPPQIASATVVTCTNVPEGFESMPNLLGGAGNTSVTAGGNAQLFIAVTVDPTASEAEQVDCAAEPTSCNHVVVAGGQAPTSASTTDPITISSAASPFGITEFKTWFSNADGTLDTQAGSHPFAATFSFGLATRLTSQGLLDKGGNEARNIAVELPPGFVGNPTAVPQCSRPDFLAKKCPNASEVGFVRVDTDGGIAAKFPVFNLVPPPGVPAELAFHYDAIVTYLDATVRSGADYGITTTVTNAPQKEVINAILTIWGAPGDRTHDRWRQQGEEPCSQAATESAGGPCSRVEEPFLKPFLTLPTSCSGPPRFRIRMNTWQHRAEGPFERSSEWHDSDDTGTGLTGCEHLGFSPTITTAPDTAKADTPAGLTVEVRPSVGGLMDVRGLSTADIQDTTVTLPEGFVVNPGQAAGLQACQETEASLKASDEAATCQGASKVGTDEIETPLLPHSLKGDVYIQQSNPPNLKLLVTASGEGVNLKLVGNVHLDERTGRLTTRFDGTPELPFTSFKLSFSGGAQAALDTPTQCGSYVTNADFDPWSSPFGADVFPAASFVITEGPGGGPCPSFPLPFAPNLTAGSTTDQAGGFTNFSLLLQRGDGQQRIERLQFKEPAGLAGMISSVPLCPEPQASNGECTDASKIGHAAVASGPGPYPLTIPQPGNPESPIFLTGPYEGAPFGLSIVTHVIAGPFDLGMIVTRAKIEIDPHTAQITVTTDPLPQIVDGVPTDLRLINSVIDRPGFLFNPTNCTHQEFTGTAWGTPPPGAGGPGATSSISTPFEVGSCQSLKFQPKVAVATAAKTSKANGASLSFKISYPRGAVGTQSWFNEAKFDFPKQLPARLTTIQKACLAATFEANPAACPPGSLIGHAIVHTPVLPVPLSGPVYFVSHGGAKFPDAVIVLQGDGVTVDLTGETFINGKTGITSATFANTPDVPFESIEVTVPSGPSSEFAANLPAKAKGSFCGQNLVMPTKFVAQNGLEINQKTKIAVSGCPKAKKLSRAQKLATAMRACKKKSKAKRAACIRQARRRYGSVKARKKK